MKSLFFLPRVMSSFEGTVAYLSVFLIIITSIDFRFKDLSN